MSENFTIIYEPADEGGFTAFIPEVPGAVSEGETKEEAREMVLDAMREILAYRREEAMKAKSASATVETLPISA
ncbi:MAG TPA: type II toxin-antitoxin system HicB family antitoxin [Fimbriimonadaceae bacterium]|nr:type II toxin-antitoxin system HicB family antitoxin [Fimbriimonadaceae bacterium]